MCSRSIEFATFFTDLDNESDHKERQKGAKDRWTELTMIDDKRKCTRSLEGLALLIFHVTANWFVLTLRDKHVKVSRTALRNGTQERSHPGLSNVLFDSNATTTQHLHHVFPRCTHRSSFGSFFLVYVRYTIPNTRRQLGDDEKKDILRYPREGNEARTNENPELWNSRSG